MLKFLFMYIWRHQNDIIRFRVSLSLSLVLSLCLCLSLSLNSLFWKSKPAIKFTLFKQYYNNIVSKYVSFWILLILFSKSFVKYTVCFRKIVNKNPNFLIKKLMTGKQKAVFCNTNLVLMGSSYAHIHYHSISCLRHNPNHYCNLQHRSQQ